MLLCLLNLCLVFVTSSVQALRPRDVVFVVVSQPDSFHLQRCRELKHSIVQQAQSLGYESPVVHLTHEEWADVDGAWTMFPILPSLLNQNKNNASFIMFLQDVTTVSLKNLLNVLQNVSPRKEVFFGRSIRDKEASIIHHFAFYEDPSKFAYPNLASGIVLSVALLKRVVNNLNDVGDFSIDIAHEFSLWLWNDGRGVALTNVPEFCDYSNSTNTCATNTVRQHYQCTSPVPRSDILFAVKTCSRFHSDRVPVVKATWGKHTHAIAFYSDIKDNSVPTVLIDVPNTEKGHCSKTLAILKLSIERSINGKWLFLADDDTLLSVSRLQSVLSCFNPDDSIILGERYGFMVASDTGYNYPTGGAGIIFSITAARSIVAGCLCPSPDSPDDMVLGMCIQNLGISLIHIPELHQARPDDYCEEVLLQQVPVSFHKHWMLDPVSVYTRWFSEADSVDPASAMHNEL